MISEQIEQFLDLLKEIESLSRQSELEETDTSSETQDILHALELQDLSYHQQAKLAKKLVDVRKRRRKAKDMIAQIEPLFKWANTNKKSIDELKQVLGNIRKLEKGAENRFYNPRTDILKD